MLAEAALAAALFTTTALATTQLPPVEYDVGTDSMTIAEIMTAYAKRAKSIGYQVIAVENGKALDMCNKLQKARYNQPFPAGTWSDPNTGVILAGCVIWDWRRVNPWIVYSYDTPEIADRMGWEYEPLMANQTLRHEMGHTLGWPDDHRGGRGESHYRYVYKPDPAFPASPLPAPPCVICKVGIDY